VASSATRNVEDPSNVIRLNARHCWTFRRGQGSVDDVEHQRDPWQTISFLA
jgi:hypothetical protein